MASKTLLTILAHFPGTANHRAAVYFAFETRRMVFSAVLDDDAWLGVSLEMWEHSIEGECTRLPYLVKVKHVLT